MRAIEFINEASLDPSGWGSTPYGTDIDYFGLRVQMKPSTFLRLALPLGSAESNPEVEKHMKAGGKIAYPMLDIEIPDSWKDGDYSKPAKVVDHEGRNRMTQWIKLKGDDPIQVNIRPRGGLRRRDLNDDYIEALSKGLVSQHGNFISGPLFPTDSALEEAETGTPESREIVQTLKNAGYNQIGSGADATVWMKDAGQVLKIVMPESQDITQAAFTFKKFYEFCMQHQDLECLPKFIPIQGQAYAEFTLGNKQYMQISMEQLKKIPRNSFDEGIVWFFSDFASNNAPWKEVNEELGYPKTWYNYNSRFANRYADKWQNLSMIKGNEQKYAEYQLLYTVMQLLYTTGKINKMYWDLHTENAMLRDDGTIVIIDPWFERYSGTIR